MLFAWNEAFKQHRNLWALLLVLLLSLLTYSSNGIIRGGDDDEGSGLGGTGRSLNDFIEPGAGSGLGGTGFRPYLGINTNSDSKTAELVIITRPLLGADRDSDSRLPTAIAASHSGTQLPQAQDARRINSPVETPARVADPDTFTRDSSAIRIEESMQWELDQQALILETRQNLLTEKPPALDEAAKQAQLDANSVSGAVDTSAGTEQGDTISWASLVQQLGDDPGTEAAILAENSDTQATTAETILRPERIQRPALPPVQRIRPVQRAGLLPPRIRPLQL
jgi:hypothetical protein